MDFYLRKWNLRCTDGMEWRLVGFFFLLPNAHFLLKLDLDNPYQLQKAYVLRYGL